MDKPSQCPRCQARSLAFILYGMPDLSDAALQRELKAGKIVLGGCLVDDRNPQWQCCKCQAYIYADGSFGDARRFDDDGEEDDNDADEASTENGNGDEAKAGAEDPIKDYSGNFKLPPKSSDPPCPPYPYPKPQLCKKPASLDPRQDWVLVKSYEDVSIAGVSYRYGNVVAFIQGAQQKLYLTAQPMQEYPHVLAVLGKWYSIGHKKAQYGQLGFVPDHLAQSLSHTIEAIRQQDHDVLMLANLTQMIMPQPTAHAGLKMNIALLEIYV